MLITQHLDTESLRSFSLANSICNDIANRSLWRTVRIASKNRQGVLLQLDAIRRLPRRASYVRRLYLGPFPWSWNAELLNSLQRLWTATPNIRDIRLPPHGASFISSHKATPGVIHTAFLRNLLTYGKHLQLRVLEIHCWLRPDSLLYELLLLHPTIEELIGIDIFTTRLPSSPPNFLPNIRALTCARQITAEFLAYHRAIQSLCITQSLNLSLRSQSLTDALRGCSGPLKEFDVFLPFHHTTDDSMLRLAESLATVEVLRLRRYEISYLPAGVKLPNLVELECETAVDHDANAVELLVNRLGARSLRRVVVISTPGWYSIPHRVWIRNTTVDGQVFIRFSSHLCSQAFALLS